MQLGMQCLSPWQYHISRLLQKHAAVSVVDATHDLSWVVNLVIRHVSLLLPCVLAPKGAVDMGIRLQEGPSQKM